MSINLQDLKDLLRDAALGPSTEAIVKEAEAKGIPWMSLVDARFLIQLGGGVNQKRIQATMSSRIYSVTPCGAVEPSNSRYYISRLMSP